MRKVTKAELRRVTSATVGERFARTPEDAGWKPFQDKPVFRAAAWRSFSMAGQNDFTLQPVGKIRVGVKLASMECRFVFFRIGPGAAYGDAH